MVKFRFRSKIVRDRARMLRFGISLDSRTVIVRVRMIRVKDEIKWLGFELEWIGLGLRSEW